MTNAPPATLKKAYTGLSSTREKSKKFMIASITCFIDLELASRAREIYRLYHYDNYLLHFYIIVGIILTATVWICLNDDAVFYKVGNLIDFIKRWITKKDFIYKHDDKKTSDKKIDDHVKAERMDDDGTIHFQVLPTYKKYKCNTGRLWVVNPQDVQDLDDFNETTALLLYSIRPGLEQKQHVIQSQDMSDIAAAYEERLKLPPEELGPAERVGLYYTKQFLQSLAGRVNWAYFIFLGTGYFTDDEKAKLEIDRIAKGYELFLENTSVEARQITSPFEYEIITKQMRSMKNIGVVTV
jgi:hypothetical protein